VPNRHDPNCPLVNTVEEPKWPDDHLAVRDVRELGYPTPGIRVILQPPQGLLDSTAKPPRCRWLVPSDEIKSLKKLFPRRLRESNPH